VAAPRTPRRRRRSLLRRAADLLVLVLAAPVVAPVVAVLALLIRLTSRGSPLITHRRVGRGGREFELHKLRTMYEDAEVRKHELAHLNVLPWPDFKIPNDPRVTPLGRWLRRTSLDELPQLWNLLRGEVTLVGPRPCSVPVERYELWQTERLHVTPGLFGRWQAEGRGSADFRERSRMDIRQLRGASLASDARLAVQSVVALLRGKGSS
jgi:lipopolysaccharide/colanic/teichoic acid biosynthesis glycosyltransferase